MSSAIWRMSFFMALALSLSGCVGCEDERAELLDRQQESSAGCPVEPECEIGARGCHRYGDVIECVADPKTGCPVWGGVVQECLPDAEWCYQGSCFSVEAPPEPAQIDGPDASSLHQWGQETLEIGRLDGLVVVPYTAFLNALRLESNFAAAPDSLVQDATQLVMHANDPNVLGLRFDYEPADYFEGDVFLVVMDPGVTPSHLVDGGGTLIESSRYFVAVMPGLVGPTSWVGNSPAFIGQENVAFPSGSCCRGVQPAQSCGYGPPGSGGIPGFDPFGPPPEGPEPGGCSEDPITCPAIPEAIAGLIPRFPEQLPFRMGRGTGYVAPDPYHFTDTLMLRGNQLPAVGMYVATHDREYHQYLAEMNLSLLDQDQQQLGVLFTSPVFCDACDQVLCDQDAGSPESSIENLGDYDLPCQTDYGPAEKSPPNRHCSIVDSSSLSPACGGMCDGYGCGGTCDPSTLKCSEGYVPGQTCHHLVGTGSRGLTGGSTSSQTCQSPGLPGWCDRGQGEACDCDQECQQAKEAFWVSFLGCGSFGGVMTGAPAPGVTCCGAEGELCACQTDSQGRGFCVQCNDDGVCSRSLINTGDATRYQSSDDSETHSDDPIYLGETEIKGRAPDGSTSEGEGEGEGEGGDSGDSPSDEEGTDSSHAGESNELAALVDLDICQEVNPESKGEADTTVRTPSNPSNGTAPKDDGVPPTPDSPSDPQDIVVAQATHEESSIGDDDPSGPPQDNSGGENRNAGNQPSDAARTESPSVPGNNGDDKRSKDGDPVALASGALSVEHRDLSFPGAVYPLTFERYYASSSDERSILGSNWTHNYDHRVIPLRPSNTPSWAPEYCTAHEPYVTCAFVETPGGNKRLFIKNPADPNSLFYPSAGATETLALLPEAWVLHGSDGRARIFNEKGYLREERDRYGNGYFVEYEPTPAYKMLRRYCQANRASDFFLRAVSLDQDSMQIEYAQDFDERSCMQLASALGDVPEPIMDARGWETPKIELALPYDGAWRGALEYLTLDTSKLPTAYDYDSDARRYVRDWINTDFAPQLPTGTRKLRPTRVTDDLGRTLEFEYYDDIADSTTFGLLRSVVALSGVTSVDYEYARPVGYPQRLHESFLTRIERSDSPTPGAGLMASPDKEIVLEYNWPTEGFDSYDLHANAVEQAYLDYFGTWRGCQWEGELCYAASEEDARLAGASQPGVVCGPEGPAGDAAGGSSSSTGQLLCRTSLRPNGMGNPCFEARRERERYISSVADNLVRIKRNSLIEVESRYIVDPWSREFDRVEVQRYGGLDVSHYAVVDPNRTTDAGWQSNYPEFHFEYVHTEAIGAQLEQDVTEMGTLPADILKRFPLEDVPDEFKAQALDPCFADDSCGGVASSTQNYEPSCGAHDRLENQEDASCDPNEHVSRAFALPGWFPTHNYFASTHTSSNPAHPELVRSRLTCNQIAAHHLGNPTHNGTLQEKLTDQNGDVYWARIEGDRDAIQADSRRICAWTKVIDRDGDSRLVGMNYRGQELVYANLIEGRWLVTERLVNADGMVIEERSSTPATRDWNPADGWVSTTYEEIDPTGNDGWNDWLGMWWNRRLNVVAREVFANTRDGQSRWSHDWDVDADVLTGREIQSHITRIAYEPIFNQPKHISWAVKDDQGQEEKQYITVIDFDYQELDPESEAFHKALFAQQAWGWRVPEGYRYGESQYRDWLLDFYVPMQFYDEDLNSDGVIGFPNYTNHVGLAFRGAVVRVTQINPKAQANDPFWVKRRQTFIQPAPHGQPARIVDWQGRDYRMLYYDRDAGASGALTATEAPAAGYGQRGMLAQIKQAKYVESYEPTLDGPFDAPLPPALCSDLIGPYQWVLPQGCGSIAADALSALGVESTLSDALVAASDASNDQARWHSTNIVYNDAGHARELLVDGARSSMVRDVDGRVLQALDPESNLTLYVRDVDGRVTRVEERAANTHELLGRVYYQYDAQGSLLTSCVEVQEGGCQSVSNDFVALVSTTHPRDTSEPEYLLQTYRYSPEGLLLSVRDENGIETSTAYDARGLITEQVRHHPDVPSKSARRVISYDDLGHVVRIEYGTDAARQSLQPRDESYVYDAFGRLEMYTDKDGVAWQYARDVTGQTVARKESSSSYSGTTNTLVDTGWEELRAYDGFGQPIVMRSHDLERTDIDYNRYGWVRRTEVRAGQQAAHQGIETWRTYDASGTPVWTLDSNGNMSARIYDSRARQNHTLQWDIESRSLSTAHHSSSTSSMDFLGHLVRREIFGASGEIQTHEFEYNARGDLETYRNPKGDQHTMQYNLVGWLEQRTDPAEPGQLSTSASTYTRNAYGQIIELVEPGQPGGTTRYGYTPFGQLESVELPLAPGLEHDRYTYDDYGRLSDHYQYANGQLDAHLKTEYTLLSDGQNRVDVRWIGGPGSTDLLASRTYDRLGRLSQAMATNTSAQIEAGWSHSRQIDVSYTHDAIGRVLAETQSISQAGSTSSYVTTSTYLPTAQGGWSRQLVYPSSSAWSSHTGRTGHVTDLHRERRSNIDERDIEIDFSWRGGTYMGAKTTYGLNNPALQPDPLVEARSFDGLGRRTRIEYRGVELGVGNTPSSPTWAATYCKGVWGPECTTPIIEIDLAYDVLDRIVSRYQRFGQPRRDDSGALVASSARHHKWQGFDYTAKSALGAHWESSNVSAAQAATIPNHTATASDLENVGWPNGSGIKWDYEREEGVGDLLAVQRADNPSVSRWSHTNSSGGQYRKPGRQLDQVSVDGFVDMQILHDGRGRVIQDTRFEYAYDPLDRLVSATPIGANTPAEVYLYDAEGRLSEVHRPDQSDIERLVYDGAQMIASYTNDQLSWEATWGSQLDHLVAYRVVGTNQDVTYLPLRDERNNIIGLWDTQAYELVGVTEYSPEGRVTLLDQDEQIDCQESGTSQVCSALEGALAFGFNTAWRSPATGLYSMRHRWYSPLLGQFVSRDPLEYVDSYNMYAFAAFDPVNGWDPWGLECKGFSSSAECIAAGAAEFYDDIGKQLEEEIQFCQNNPGACDADAEDIAKELAKGLLDTAAKEVERYGNCLLENFGNTLLCSLPVNPADLAKLWYQRKFRSLGKQIGGLILDAVLGASGVKGVSRVDGKIRIKRTGDGGTNRSGKKKKDGESHKKPCESCFVGNTPVHMCDGSTRLIGELAEGDFVLSRDENTGELGCNKITAIHVSDVDRIYKLDIYEPGTGEFETFYVTGSHPFITWQNGQVRVENLTSQHIILGDSLERYFVVTSKHQLVRNVRVFNLTVEHQHTFFVGLGGTWVHNTGGDDPCDNDIWAQFEKDRKRFDEEDKKRNRDSDQTSGEQMANDHAGDHLNEFPEVTDKKQLAELIDGIINNPDDVRVLERGRTAYWSDDGIIVIVDPNSHHGGTAFRPPRGYKYFRDVK